MNLPPLPEPLYCDADAVISVGDYRFFTADQMRAYGQACVEAAQPKPLTVEEIEDLWSLHITGKCEAWFYDVCRAIEAAVREQK